MTLPTDARRRWGVYALVLAKEGAETLVYTGSGTSARYRGLLGLVLRSAVSLRVCFGPRDAAPASQRPYILIEPMARTRFLIWQQEFSFAKMVE